MIVFISCFQICTLFVGLGLGDRGSVDKIKEHCLASLREIYSSHLTILVR